MLALFLLKKLRGSKLIPLSNTISANHTRFSSGSSSFCSASEIQHSEERTDANFTISYLVESLGLGIDTAKRISKNLILKSTEKPDAVLKFFKSYGFSHSQIVRIVGIKPQVLLSNPEKFLKPKLEFFASFNAEPATVAKIVETCPAILCSSLEKRIVPSLEMLKSLVVTDQNVVSMMLKGHNLFYFHLHDALKLNVATLREFGVLESLVKRAISQRTYGLLHSPARFKMSVEKVMGMGFDVNRFSFVEAAILITKLRDHGWDQRCNVLRKWGWSDTDLSNAFLKHPLYMWCAEKKMDETMEFLVNYMGFASSFVAEIPWVFKYRFERVVARYSVIKTLLRTGVIANNDWKLGSVVIDGEPKFLDKFVKKQETLLPQLYGLYSQSKIDGKPF